MSEEERRQLRDVLIHEPEIAEWLGDDGRDDDESNGDENRNTEI